MSENILPLVPVHALPPAGDGGVVDVHHGVGHSPQGGGGVVRDRLGRPHALYLPWELACAAPTCTIIV